MEHTNDSTTENTAVDKASIIAKLEEARKSIWKADGLLGMAKRGGFDDDDDAATLIEVTRPLFGGACEIIDDTLRFLNAEHSRREVLSNTQQFSGATADDAGDGPAHALSVLYEANDLLSILRDRGEADMDAPDWTLTAEIKERMESAIALLDGAVAEPPEKADGEEYQIPQVITRRDDQTIGAHLAAIKSAKHLNKADGRIAVAADLCETLLGFLRETDIAECLQAATVVEQIVRQLEKARGRLDRHCSQYNNLFIAYFEKPQEPAAPPAA